jgi:hypothetical protein
VTVIAVLLLPALVAVMVVPLVLLLVSVAWLAIPYVVITLLKDALAARAKAAAFQGGRATVASSATCRLDVAQSDTTVSETTPVWCSDVRDLRRATAAHRSATRCRQNRGELA